MYITSRMTLPRTRSAAVRDPIRLKKNCAGRREPRCPLCLVVWSVWLSQTNQIDQMNQSNHDEEDGIFSIPDRAGAAPGMVAGTWAARMSEVKIRTPHLMQDRCIT